MYRQNNKKHQQIDQYVHKNVKSTQMHTPKQHSTSTKLKRQMRNWKKM